MTEGKKLHKMRVGIAYANGFGEDRWIGYFVLDAFLSIQK